MTCPSAARGVRPPRTVAVLAVAVALAACSTADQAVREGPGAAGAARPAPRPVPVTERLEVPPPPITEGLFPCSACHAGMPVNRTRRALTEMHADIEFDHDEQHRWCLDCHDAENRDVLHLAGGEPVPFEESYRLCGQCHGEKLRDWTAGVHGRRTGQWNGHKTYLLCAHCHDPHRPRFRPIRPEAAPRPPAGPGTPGGARGGRAHRP